MSFQDIFKSGFLENATSISLFDMGFALVMALLLGMFVFFVYKKSYSGVMYSPSFGIVLIAITLITTMLIMTVVSNVVLSLGMVGALSIVRFRTAIKEPQDIAFLFWSISIGIVLAAELLPLAVVGSLFIGLTILVLSQHRERTIPYILVVRCQDESTECNAREFIFANAKKMSLKSKTVQSGEIEVNYEVRLKDGDSTLVNALSAMDGVMHCVLVSYNGDYMG